MSPQMYLTNKETRKDVAEINWLRNPFGLCNWAEDNAGDGHSTLHFVCNHWAYGESIHVDRLRFLSVVSAYNAAVQALTEGFFFFNLSDYRQFIEGKVEYLETDGSLLAGLPIEIVDSKYDEQNRLAIPMRQFSHRAFDLGGEYRLEDYKAWFIRLVGFAELLQNPDNVFYCRN